MSEPLWYKDAVIYEAHVRAFFDSNDDGVGDFPGLTGKLDYLQGLGINALWLLPFYPSPLRDDGYDIADYESVHPSYGTVEDVDRFIDEAHKRGIRVITELVINHTSDQHPWFQAARRAPAGSPERDFYVWSETKQKYQGVRTIFSDTETSNWSWDDTAKAYYWHRFFHHQPDLNFDNPRVLDAVFKTMRFWLDRGVDGMRLDAVPYLIEREGTTCDNLEETHAVLRKIRHAMDERYADRMLIAEANVWPADVRPYFGNGDECHMAFNFPLMPRMFMAIRQEDRHPITDIVRQTPEIPDNCQWGLFLRNHDELTLEMVTDEERDYMVQAYAADPRMRINGGIRRRLAPLVENSRRQIELLHSLLFSLPGTPVIYYGDEIGMGDNIYLGDRNGVRTPMQWTGDRNAGFSRADPARLYAPVVMDAVYGYPSINVEAQERAPFSLLNWMKRMIALRRQFKVFGRGTLEFLPAPNRKVLAYVRRLEDEVILCVANLSRAVQPVELDLSAFSGFTPVEMLGLTEFPKIGQQPYFLTLPGYFFYWFRLQLAPASVTALRAPETAVPVETLPTFLMGVTWDALLDGNVRILLEREALIPFLQRQRWFGGKARTPRAARFVDWGLLRKGPDPAFLTIVEVEYDAGQPEQYLLPLAIVTGPAADVMHAESPHLAVAHITGARRGLLVDGAADEGGARALLETLDAEPGDGVVRMKRGVVSVRRTPAYREVRGDAVLTPRRVGVGEHHTSIAYGDRLILTLFRRVERGPSPQVELGEHLASHTSFGQAPRLAGALQYKSADGASADLCVAHQFLANQGDGWGHAMGELRRFYDEVTVRGTPSPDLLPARHMLDLASEPAPRAIADLAGAYMASAQVLGRRTAELHLALASDTGTGEFAPEAWTRDDSARLAADLAGQLRQADAQLEAESSAMPGELAAEARDVVTRAAAAPGADVPAGSTVRIRVHGSYHLGQVLWVEGDFYVLDFGGAPARPLEERRRKESPLKDVASMLRSFSYASQAALLAHTAGRAGELERVHQWARAWVLWTRAAFLKGYLGTAGAAAAWLPPDPRQRAALLDLFLLNETLHELNDELNIRPDWARIPLRSLSELLE